MAGEDEISLAKIIPDLDAILDGMSSRADIYWINSSKDRYPLKC